jgi:hypothetical protein
MLYLNNIFHDKYIIPPLAIGLTEASVGRHFILQRHQFLNYYAFLILNYVLTFFLILNYVLTAFLILNYVFFFYHLPNQKYWWIAVAARIAGALRLPLHKIYPIRSEYRDYEGRASVH